MESHKRAQEVRGEPQIQSYTHPSSAVRSGAFLYNARICLPFLPCLFVMLSLGGKLTLGTVIVGTMVTYICDLRGSKEGTLMGLWGTLIATEFGLLASGVFLFQHSLINIFLLFNVAVFLVITGMWGSLQVKWVSEFQIVVVGMERCIFAVLPYPSSILLTWAAIASQGIENAPFYLLLFLAANFFLFGLPTKSSFRPRESQDYVLGKLETVVFTGAIVLLPACLYVAIYHAVMTRSLLHVTNVGLLVTLPLLAISLLVSQGSLWWVAPNYYATKQPTTDTEVYLEKIGRLLRFAVTFVVVGCLEHRLVFHSPSLYHALALFPPWSYIIVTIALYSIVIIAYYLHSGTRGLGKRARVLLLSFGCLSGFSAGLVLGAPLYVYPFILLVVHSLVSFYFKRKFLNYLLFVVGTVVCLSWFVAKTYAFIEYTFIGLQMSYVATLIIVQFTLTLLVPGLMAVASDNLPGVAGLVLFLHSVGVAGLEYLLHTQDSEIYPYYLVVFTSVVGSTVFYRLHQTKKVTLFWRWLGIALYTSKLAVVLTSVDYAIVYTFFLILSISVLYVIPTSKMSSQQGFLHAIIIGCMVFFSRNAILAKIVLLFTQQQQLTPMATFACFFVAWGFGLVPLAFRFFPHVPLVRAANFALVTCGALLYLVSSDASPSARTQAQTQGTSWAKWFLLVGLVLLVFVTTSLINLNRHKNMRLLMPVVIGTCLGLYISGSFIPLPPPRTAYTTSIPFVVVLQHFLHGAVLACAGLFLSLSHWPPPPSSSHLVAWVYGTFVSLFPILYILANQAYVYAPSLRRKESILMARVILVGLYAALNFLLSLFLQLKASRAIGTATGRQSRDVPPPRRTPISPSDWSAPIGNFATIFSFLLSTYLHIFYMGGSELAILVLAPVLLLLHRDSRWLRHLTESNRYFPIIFTISIVLAAYSLKWLLFPTTLPLYTVLWWWRLKNVFLLMLTLPGQYFFNKFLWDSKQHNPSVWIWVSAINALPLVFTDLRGVQCLAVVGIVGWVVQYLDTQEKKKKQKRQAV